MRFHHLSLRTQMTLAISAVVFAFMLITAIGALFYFKQAYKRTTFENQAVVAQLLAQNIDNTLRTLLEALQSNAQAVPPPALTSAQAAYDFLSSRTGLKRFFTNHLLLLNSNGRPIAVYTLDNEKSDTPPDFSRNPAFQRCLQTATPQISDPETCCSEKHDLQLIFFAPVVRNEKTVAVLAGSFNLLTPNVLSNSIKTKIGQQGLVRLINNQHIILAHEKKERIGQKAASDAIRGVNQAVQSGGAQIENQGLYGDRWFTSFQRLATAPWVVAISVPRSEVYAPANAAGMHLALATLLGMMAATAAVFVALRLLTRPLAQLTQHIEQLSQKQGPDRIIQLEATGEIGRLAQAFNTMINETEQYASDLRDSEQRYRIVNDFSNDFSYWRRPDGSFEFVSPACAEITGYSMEAFYEKPTLLEEIVHPADRHLLEAMLQEENTTFECHGNELEYRIVAKDGSTRWVRRTCRPIFDENGAYLGRRGSLTDITDKKLLADQVSHLVLHDLLTGLPNRALFVDRLAVTAPHAVRENELVAILFFGLDRFKLINDTMGHEAGDRLLIMTADRLRKLLHGDDTLCRFGGDVFAFILMGRESKHEAVTMAYRILASLNEPFELENGRKVLLTGSIGIALCPADGKDPEPLLKNAETAMYEAKRGGKNSFRFYSQEMNAQAAEILTLDNSMPASLANGDFYLQFQPQLDLKTNAVVGVEALARWRHPELGFIGPDRFIPLAEENGFIIKMGEWVLRTACFQNAAWLNKGMPPLRIAVNISGRQFSEPDFVDQVAAALADSKLPPHLLELELTESMLVSDVQQSLLRLRQLKKMGVQLAIDDFGTGYSSLSYLKHFALDRLKIDKSFINDILTDPDDAAITEAIIAMAHSLKMQVIAEGVETIEQLIFLEDRGCNEIQGYYLSKPLSEHDLISFVTDRLKNKQ